MIEGDVWRPIPDFPSYLVSVDGQIFNSRQKKIMKTSTATAGHVKITLTDQFGDRSDRSVAKLVATAFIEPHDELCNGVVVLDGDLSNVCVQNLTWRPRWFAFKYSRQLKTRQPTHYHNLPIRNRTTGVEYGSVVEAGMVEGLLFPDIWRSIEMGDDNYPLYPQGYTFEVIE